MPIVYRRVPDEVNEAVRTGVKLMASKRAFHTPLLRSALTEKAEVPSTGQALPVYHLGLSDIAESSDINVSTHTGWRYTLKHDDKILAHAETVIDPNGKNLFAAINEGPLVEGTAKAIKVAEEQSEIKSGKFEVRLLFIPALYVTALWLAAEKDKNDFAVPIEPTPEPLTPNKLVPLNEFLAILQRKAKTVLEAYRGKEGLVG